MFCTYIYFFLNLHSSCIRMLGKKERQKGSKKQTNKEVEFRICLSQNNIVANGCDMRLAQWGSRRGWCRTVGLLWAQRFIYRLTLLLIYNNGGVHLFFLEWRRSPCTKEFARFRGKKKCSPSGKVNDQECPLWFR